MSSSKKQEQLLDLVSTLRQVTAKSPSLESQFLQHLEQLYLFMTEENRTNPTGTGKTRFMSDHSSTSSYPYPSPNSFKMVSTISSTYFENTITSTLTVVT